MGLMSRRIGQDPASEADREDRPGNHSVCDLEVVFLCDLVVGAVDAPAHETTQTTEPEQLGRPVQDDARVNAEPPEPLGRPVQDREPKPTLSQKLTGTLDSLLFGKNESAAEPEAAVSNQKK